MQTTTGQVIASKFVLERPLARGGMGSVWVGRHLSLDVPVAIKFMHEALATAGGARARFEREARAAARLRSPHVVQILDYGVDGGTPYMVLELLEGEDLRRRLAHASRLSLQETSTIVSQIAKGLGLAHEAGIVHRDIKPSNIYLARIGGPGGEELVKLLDFGVAKHTDAPRLDDGSSTGGKIMGSPWYMSPEQARGGVLDHRSDLWSLGVVVFEALTGHHPFAGEHVGDVVVKICGDELPRASEVAPDLPAAVDLFFARALCRSPDGRPASARELAEELARLANATSSGTALPARSAPPTTAGFREEATASQIGGGGLARGVASVPSATSAVPDDSSAGVTSLPSSPRARGVWWLAATAALAVALWLVGRSWMRDPAAAQGAPESAATITATQGRAADAPIVEPAPLGTDAATAVPSESARAPKRVAPTRPNATSSRPPAAQPAASPAGTAREPARQPAAVDPKFGIPVDSERRP